MVQGRTLKVDEVFVLILEVQICMYMNLHWCLLIYFFSFTAFQVQQKTYLFIEKLIRNVWPTLIKVCFACLYRCCPIEYRKMCFIHYFIFLTFKIFIVSGNCGGLNFSYAQFRFRNM